MDRRRFLRCLGLGCAGALAGCRMQRAATDATTPESTMTDVPRDADAATNPDWDVSVCGLNCARCKLFAQGKCGGCRGALETSWSPDCPFRSCAAARGVRTCAACADFPCEHLRAFAADGYEHHAIAVENLKAIREVGLEVWIASQPKPMFCPGWRF